MPNRRKLETYADQIKFAYSEGEMTLRELALHHKVSPGTIRNLLVAHGVTLRKRGRRSARRTV